MKFACKRLCFVLNFYIHFCIFIHISCKMNQVHTFCTHKSVLYGVGTGAFWRIT